jgi:predicted hydrocarbon binding protein
VSDDVIPGNAAHEAFEGGRRLPNERMRWLMLAIQHEMGSVGLPLVLRQAGLDRFVGRLPPPDRRPAPLPEDYAALLRAVRQYYGPGARGMLIRIGRECFRRERANRPAEFLLHRLALRLRPAPDRTEHVLRPLATRWARPGNHVAVERTPEALWLLDGTGDRTHAVAETAPCCWTAVGEIAEAVLWLAGTEPVVEETECRGAGAPACSFRIA